MNPYFLCFSLYALLIAPLTLRFRLRLGRQTGYRMRLQLVGLPFVAKREPADRRDEEPLEEREVAKTLLTVNPAVLSAALDRRVRQSLVSALKLEELWVYARFSFPDACATALWYSAVTTALRSLSTAGALPPAFRWQTELDFRARGTEALVQGIVTVRLGSLLPMAAAFLTAYREKAAAAWQ